MMSEIISRSVSTSNNFNPSRSSQGFSVPAIAGVVGHFVLQVLSESNIVVGVKSDVLQEKEDSDEEVTEGFVVDDFLFNGLTDGDPFWLTHVLLNFSTVKWELDVSDVLELLMAFILWIDKVFNFSHLELSYSQQGISWSDFVSESQTDLGSSKGQSSSIVV